eukprot:CAMPEP_0171172346 /NCGR_PEP_ID=MMETSP0790-20130122/9674_1 /TAXON_ID=2925 /ORGANISM="Alexandrium catenella, Strain OF101" /LENGTH=211 /DNA_ID=CAMNT_0011637205 /DNA_START=53 /DNA_END=688 /DNA_ORIENTATION=+
MTAAMTALSPQVEVNVFVIIAVQTTLLAFLQFGEKVLPSNFAARKSCHAGSGFLMLLLDSSDPIARWYVYSVVAFSLSMTWRLTPDWVPQFRFGEVYDAGITIYLIIVAAWFYLQMPVCVLAPLFFADPAGAIIGKFCSRRGCNQVWWENKTVMGTLAVFIFAAISLDLPGFWPKVLVAAVCALAEAFGGKTFDNAVIAVPVIGSWAYYNW